MGEPKWDDSFQIICNLLSLALKIDVILAIFRQEGIFPDDKDLLIAIDNTFEISGPICFIK